jgi:hypothetical protein
VGLAGFLGFQIVIGALALLAFIPRLASRPYRGFSLVVVDPNFGAAAHGLTGRMQVHAAFFLWWRQIVASILALILAMPLNILLGLMGIHVMQWIIVFAGVLVIGPILLKMLIGHEFSGFRIEARRQPFGDMAAIADTPADAI